MAKIRLDQLLVHRGLAPSRQKAQAMILAGLVLVDDKPLDKAGTQVPAEADIRLRGDPIPFVSRGGLKLEHAIGQFHPDLSGKTALDVGISTGGFTDCLLQHGVARVYGVDVGRGQVAWKLRQDERVVLFESCNFRHFDPAALGEKVDLAVVDVSFISLALILPVVRQCLAAGAHAIPLVKPQFEVGRENIGARGVVRDPDLRYQAVERIKAFAQGLDFEVLGETESPFPGPKGNVEFLLYLKAP